MGLNTWLHASVAWMTLEHRIVMSAWEWCEKDRMKGADGNACRLNQARR